MFFFLVGHQDEYKWDLLGIFPGSDESILCQELLEGVTNKLERSVHVPGFCMGQRIQLLLSGEDQMPCLLYCQVGLQETGRVKFLDQFEVQIPRVLRSEFLSEAVCSSCHMHWLWECWTRCFYQYV